MSASLSAVSAEPALPQGSTNAVSPVEGPTPGLADRFTLALGLGCFFLLAATLLVDMIKGLLSR